MEYGLSVVALVCSLAGLGCALVVALRTTPTRVRKAAFDAMQLAEEAQLGVQAIGNRTVSFMEEVTRERAAAAADLEEAERKRRQAAAKLSKVNGAAEAAQQPKTAREMLDAFPPGDPRRLQLLRQLNPAAREG